MSLAVTNHEVQDIVIDEVFPHAAAKLWKVLTDGALMARWLMEPVGFEPVVGKHFTFKTTPAGVWDGTIECQVLEVVHEQRIAFSWKGGHESNIGYGSRLETSVTWTLTETVGGTRVRLVHAGFVLPKNETAFDKMSAGWQQVVRKVDAIAGEAVPPTPRH